MYQRFAVNNPLKCPNKAKQTIKLCKLQCSIPHYKDWSQRMSLEALCPSCANYQYQTTELRKRFPKLKSPAVRGSLARPSSSDTETKMNDNKTEKVKKVTGMSTVDSMF